MYLTGLLQSFGLVVISVAFNIIIRIGSVNFDLEPITFACVSIVTGSLVLSLFAGPGRLIGDSVKNPSTWFYGFSAIGVFIFDVYLTHYVSATEMSLFSRVAIPISFLISAVIFKRKQEFSDIFGLVFVLIGLGLLFYIQPIYSLSIIALLSLGTGLSQASEVIFTQNHKQSVKANETGNMRDKARVVGFVSFTTSMMFLSFVLIGAIIHQYLLPDVEALSFLPELNRFAHAPSVWFGLLFGAFLSSTYRYFLWSSSYKLKSDNILALLALVPLLTFATEWLLSFSSYFQDNESMLSGDRGMMVLISCGIITFGSAISVFLRVGKSITNERTGSLWTDIKRAMTINTKDITIQHAANGLDDYEIVCAAVEHCYDDIEKAAKLLEVPLDALNVVKDAKGRYAFVADVSQDVARRFRQNVALSDALTGLANRSAFMANLKASIASKINFSIMFIDLDKFKPVNDTYGHEAGDMVLKGIAERLENNAPKGSLATRLGGDEFCLLIPNMSKSKAKQYANEIKEIVSKSFKFNEHTINVGASIGIATFPEDSDNAKELLKIADEGMYNDK